MPSGIDRTDVNLTNKSIIPIFVKSAKEPRGGVIAPIWNTAIDPIATTPVPTCSTTEITVELVAISVSQARYVVGVNVPSLARMG